MTAVADETPGDVSTTSALARHRHVGRPARLRARLARRRALRAIVRREREIEMWRREFGSYGLRRRVATERDL